jgi:ubiquitin fusion degradation protein 1
VFWIPIWKSTLRLLWVAWNLNVERPKAAPPVTMAKKLKIDLNSHSPGSSRPGSSLSGGFAGTQTGIIAVSKDGDHWESFKGKGETLSGRKTKAEGISNRKAEQVTDGSKIIRTESVLFSQFHCNY